MGESTFDAAAAEEVWPESPVADSARAWMPAPVTAPAVFAPASAVQQSSGVPGYGQTNAAPSAYAGMAAGTPFGEHVPVEPHGTGGGAGRKKRVVLGSVAAGVVVVLAVGAAFAYTTFFRGSSTPEEAVEQLVDGVLTGDLIALGTAIAPSEVSALQPAMEDLQRLSETPASQASGAYSEIIDAVDVTVSGLEYETETVTDGVAIVRVVAGTIEATADEATLVDAVVALQEESLRSTLEEWGYTASEIEDQVASVRQDAQTWVDDTFPWRGDIEDAVDSLTADETDGLAHPASPIAFVAVEEGGWYISPMLTLAEYGLWAQGDSAGRRGTDVVPAAPSATAEEAVESTAEAIEQLFATGDVEDLAATLPLAERRVVSLYGNAVLDGVDWSSAPAVSIEVDASPAGDDARPGRLELTDLQVAVEPTDDWGVTTTLAYADGCFSVDDGWSQQTCLRDLPTLDEWGVDGLYVTAVQEQGGWLVSPWGTFGDYLAQFAQVAVEHDGDGGLGALGER
ncbi:hypothetical protein [Demequina sp.]|uniref:hypothetical protein n=1 Tax=Demequina sp. TaxID=2050685 RepID=UPI003A8A6D09